ncbi:MAG: hypothetical protein Tsb0020_00660 [Haliangiales bacterium]
MPPPPTAPDTPPPVATRARLRARIRAFDAPALLAALADLGYRRGDIRYRSHFALGPQPSLFHDIEFFAQGGRERALVTVNLGFLSCRSPLPSYFLALLHDMDIREPLMALLGVIDDRLIGERLAGHDPADMFGNRLALERHLFRLSGPGAVATLASLFGHIFPELDVTARRHTGQREVSRPAARIGYTSLGTCVFGARSAVPVSAVEVTLRCAESDSRPGTPWAVEAHSRLSRYVFPLLGELRLHLVVVLLLLDRDTYVRFDGESYVGYDPLKGGVFRPHRVVLFDGRVPDAGPTLPEQRD